MPDQTQILLEIHRTVGSMEGSLKGMYGELTEAKGELKEVKEVSADLKLGQTRLEAQLGGLPCGVHASQIHELRTEMKDTRGEVKAVDEKVDRILVQDLPDIRTKLEVLSWWKSSRNKVFAAVFVAALGVLGALIADFIKDWVSTPASAAQTEPARPEQK